VIAGLGKVCLALQGSGYIYVARAVRRELPLPLLAKEEEQLVLRVDFRYENRSADRVSGVVVPEKLTGQAFGIVQPAIGVEAVVAVIPIAAAVKLVCAALCDHRDLRSGIAAVFGLIDSRENLEFLRRIQTDRYVLLAVVAGIN